MSALTDRITEVVAAYPKADEHHCGSPDCVGSARYHCWAAHVAEQVAEALRPRALANDGWCVQCSERGSCDLDITCGRGVMGGWAAVEADKP